MRRFVCLAVLALLWPGLAFAQLTEDDVHRVIAQAVERARKVSPASVIAVTDREGFVLGVWNVAGGQPGVGAIAAAVAKAGTSAFLSSNQDAFTSRTAGFIIQQHFPPGVFNTPTGPLVGVGFSNLPFSDVNRFKRFPADGVIPLDPSTLPPGQSTGTRGLPVAGTSLSGSPGGVPLFKNGILVGGIGVTGDGSEFSIPFNGNDDADEDVALSGQRGFEPSPDIFATNVFINGISLPYVEGRVSTQRNQKTGKRSGNIVDGYPIRASPPAFPYPVITIGGQIGAVRQPIMDDPLPGTINGQARLTAAEVTGILAAGADRARTTRAGIRLPIGVSMQVFITVVNNPNQPGVKPVVLGTFQTQGQATIFSWDVAVQKARTALFFSTNSFAASTRTVGFLAESNFPPGIDADPPGPYNGLQERFSASVNNPDRVTFSAPDPNLPNGITIFPGGFPLYRNGQLIGAIGVSGDGVDQDDIVGASGTKDFLAPDAIRADQFSYNGARLPYAKFPRDPER